MKLIKLIYYMCHLRSSIWTCFIYLHHAIICHLVTVLSFITNYYYLWFLLHQQVFRAGELLVPRVFLFDILHIRATLRVEQVFHVIELGILYCTWCSSYMFYYVLMAPPGTRLPGRPPAPDRACPPTQLRAPAPSYWPPAQLPAPYPRLPGPRRLPAQRGLQAPNEIFMTKYPAPSWLRKARNSHNTHRSCRACSCVLR